MIVWIVFHEYWADVSVTLSIFIVMFFRLFFIMTGQCRVDKKMLGEERGIGKGLHETGIELGSLRVYQHYMSAHVIGT